MSPTSASPTAYGATICSVSVVSGTSGGIIHVGNPPGSSPWSATSGTSRPNSTTIPVSTTMAISAAGTAVVSFGMNTIIAMPAATSGYTAHGTSNRCRSCAVKMRIASALTKPIITDLGMNRMSFATPGDGQHDLQCPRRATLRR